jgi:adenylate cyclase
MVSQYGENIYVSGTALLAFVLWLLGLPAQAAQASLSSVAMARQANHANSLAFALSNAALLNRMLKQVETSGQFAQEIITLAQQHGLPFWLEIGISSYGWVLVMQGQTAGIAQIQKYLDTNSDVTSGAKLFFLIPLCDALVHLGQFKEALPRINEALILMNATDSRFFESEFLRLKGVCLLEISAANTDEAEACFEQALAVSRKQHAKSLELRAAMSVVRLRQQQDKQADARHMLEEIYNGFTEGFDTCNLQEAAELLRTLA